MKKLDKFLIEGVPTEKNRRFMNVGKIFRGEPNSAGPETAEFAKNFTQARELRGTEAAERQMANAARWAGADSGAPFKGFDPAKREARTQTQLDHARRAARGEVRGSEGPVTRNFRSALARHPDAVERILDDVEKIGKDPWFNHRGQRVRDYMGRADDNAKGFERVKELNDALGDYVTDSSYDMSDDALNKMSHLGGASTGDSAFGDTYLDEDNDLIVKKGMLGANELRALHRLRDFPEFPNIINAQFDGDFTPIADPYGDFDGSFFEGAMQAPGRFAMTKARGMPSYNAFGYMDEDTEEKAIRNFWKARARMHQAGLAHNDMHGGNIYIDPNTGDVSVIDMGLASDNPLASLMEGIGGMTGGDYQMSERFTSNMPDDLKSLMEDNTDFVKEFLIDRGDGRVFDDDEAWDMIDSIGDRDGIRLSEDKLEDLRQTLDLSPDDIQEALRRLYYGVLDVNESFHPGWIRRPLNEVKGEQAHKQAVAMGLKYKGFGYWVDPKTGETAFKTVQDKLVPVEPDVESEKWQGGDEEQAGMAGGGGGAPAGGGMMGGAPSAGSPGMSSGAGQGVLGVADQAKRPWEPISWTPGPDGNTAVNSTEPDLEVPLDTFIGRTNNLNWTAGPDGNNFTNISYDLFVGEAQMKSYKAVLKEGMLEQIAAKMANTNGQGLDPDFDLAPYLNRPGGVRGNESVSHLSPDRNTSIKSGNIGFNEIEALQKLKNVKGVPNLINTSVDDGVFSPDGTPNPNMFNGQMATSAIPGMPVGDIGMSLNKDLQNTAKNNLWKLRKQIHQNGVANNDMSPQNVQVNPDSGDIGIRDFGGSELGFGPAFFEALGSDKTDPMSGSGDMPFADTLETLGGSDPNMMTFKGNKEKLIKDFLKRNKSNPMGLPLDEKGLQGLMGGGTHLSDGENQTPMAHKFKKLLDNFNFSDEDFKGFINLLYNGVGEELINSTKKKAKPNKSFRHPPITKKRVKSDD